VGGQRQDNRTAHGLSLQSSRAGDGPGTANPGRRRPADRGGEGRRRGALHQGASQADTTAVSVG